MRMALWSSPIPTNCLPLIVTFDWLLQVTGPDGMRPRNGTDQGLSAFAGTGAIKTIDASNEMTPAGIPLILFDGDGVISLHPGLSMTPSTSCRVGKVTLGGPERFVSREFTRLYSDLCLQAGHSNSRHPLQQIRALPGGHRGR